MLIFPHSPNTVSAFAAPGSTSWVVVAMDGTTYTTTAALVAAGKTFFPYGNASVQGLDLGMKLQTLTLTSVNAGAAGSAFYFSKNPQVTPSGTIGEFVNNNGMQIVVPGTVWQIWIKLTASTDTIELFGQF